MIFDEVQLRVLGALIEKEIVTPETYPLSLNALLAASNQRSSRDPVMELTEEQVRQALHALEDQGTTGVVRDGRVAKFEHKIRTVLNLRRDETAVLCLLLLRGPQTAGELRGRADRLFSFDDLEAVQSALERLASRPEPLVVLLAKQPGSREARYQHLLGGPVALSAREPVLTRASAAAGMEKVRNEEDSDGETLETRVSRLQEEVGALRSRLEAMERRHAQGEILDSAAGPLEPAV